MTGTANLEYLSIAFARKRFKLKPRTSLPMPTKTTAQRAAGSAPAPGVTPQRVLANLGAAELVEHAIRRNEGQLSDRGAFTALTSPHTGRSPKDKFVVDEPDSTDRKSTRLNSSHSQISYAVFCLK